MFRPVRPATPATALTWSGPDERLQAPKGRLLSSGPGGGLVGIPGHYRTATDTGPRMPLHLGSIPSLRTWWPQPLSRSFSARLPRMVMLSCLALPSICQPANLISRPSVVPEDAGTGQCLILRKGTNFWWRRLVRCPLNSPRWPQSA